MVNLRSLETLCLTDGGCRIGDIKVEKIFLETKPKLFEMKIISKMRHCGNRVLADGG
jgi:hypothetical protein